MIEVKPQSFGAWDKPHKRKKKVPVSVVTVLTVMVRKLKYLQAEQSDAELVVLSLRDSANYAVLVRRYEPKLMRYIRRFAGLGREDAEDVLQVTFLKAYVNLNDFDRSLKFSSWIYRIAHNESVNFLRKRTARPKTGPIFGDIAAVAESLDIEAAIDKKILASAVRRAVKMIKPAQREALVLKFFEDKDYREISDILKKPMGTVATLISRAKRQLKAILARDGIAAWPYDRHRAPVAGRQTAAAKLNAT